jgi:hypothetical protein
MKKKVFLVLFACLLSGFCSNAQRIDGIPISEIDKEYLQIIGVQKFLKTKWRIYVDMGQESKIRPFTTNESVITDKDGNIVDFNSMIDALNFMSKNGYEYLDSYVFFGSEQQNTIYYILKKKKIE